MSRARVIITNQRITNKKCSFSGVEKIITSAINESRKENIIQDTLTNLQRKINFEIEEQMIGDDRISFALSGAKEIR